MHAVALSLSILGVVLQSVEQVQVDGDSNQHVRRVVDRETDL